MKDTFTPGPWHTEPEEWTEGRGRAVCSKGGIVAIIDPEVCMSVEDAANARLIAAAPELLSALKEAEKIMSADCTDGAVLNRIRAAIKKVGAQ